MGASETLSDLLFPPRCAFCRALVDREAGGICDACREALPFLTGRRRHSEGEFFEDCVSLLRYEGSVRASLLRYKFRGRRSYCRCYGRLLAQTVREEYPECFDLVTWVPVSTLRRWRRGYDQAQLLAEETAEALGLEAAPLLRKPRHNPAQSSISEEAARRANVLNAYRAAGDAAGKTILLVDDIITTGATLGEAARTLLMAGADTVLCATLAKAMRSRAGKKI